VPARAWILGLLMFVAIAAGAKAAPPAVEPVIMRDNVAIPMRDGVNLRAMIALPAGGKGRWPIVLTITPYQRDGGWAKAQAYAREGYVFVAIDTRGRGDSDGVFDPWVNDGRDAYDAIEWLATQPFSDGAIGMWGSSYGGFNQWAAAALRPPHLKSIMPAAAGLPAIDFPLNRNMMRPYAASWAAYVSARTGHARFFDDLAYQAAAFERVLKSGRSQADLDAELGFSVSPYQGFVAHPLIDDYWRSRSPDATGYAGITIPVLSITGQWDGAQNSALEHWRRHWAAAPNADHFLIIGPFDHAGTRYPKDEVGGLKIAPNGVLDMFALDLAWFDWTLRGGARPAFLKDRVAYYVMGENSWHYAPTLPGITANRTLWLTGSTLTDRAPRRANTATYRNDPANLTKFRLGTWYAGSWLTYQQDVQALAGDGLIYLTQPLNAPITLAGRPKVRVPLTITTPDADFRVRLYDVAADGSSVLLAQDRMRARYRVSAERAVPVTPGRSYSYDFDQMTFVARTISTGHKLRLVIDTPNSIYDQRNMNSGGDVAHETLADAHAATVSLTEGGHDPARLILPLIQGSVITLPDNAADHERNDTSSKTPAKGLR
jgi:uncharacterized protein